MPWRLLFLGWGAQVLGWLCCRVDGFVVDVWVVALGVVGCGSSCLLWGLLWWGVAPFGVVGCLRGLPTEGVGQLPRG